MVNVVFLGPPGCGKGTQADILKKDMNMVKLSTGDILREIVKENTDFGNQVKKIMDSGELVSDNLIIEILMNEVSKYNKNSSFIFDGFPRTIEQAKALELKFKIDKVFNFSIDYEIIIKRITNRYSCKHCGAIYNRLFNPCKVDGICDKCGSTSFSDRSDDEEEAIRKRLSVYDQKTKALIDFYDKKGVLINVDSNNSINEIYANLSRYLK